MRALQYAETGGPEVLHVTEIPEPHAGPGQVRIGVAAAGVNPIDWKLRSGAYGGSLPATTALDAAGTIDEVGEGVEDVAVGDRVFGSAVGGAAAEHAVLHAWARVPDGMSLVEAAGLPLAVETAARALDVLGVTDGTTLLVNAAAGGVGAAAVQLAVARGATVLGTASEANHDFLRGLGAIPTTYGDGLPDRVAPLAPQGVDLALDAAGRGALPDLIAITGSADRVVTIADPAAGELGVRVTSGMGGEPRAWYALADAADLHAQGRFALPVQRTFPLEEGAAAHRESEAGHVRGKLVLVVDPQAAGS